MPLLLDSLRLPVQLLPIAAPDTARPTLPSLSRWSFGLALGFDVTHRRLTGTSAAPLERAERTSTAGQAAVSIGYALSSRWRLRAGAGYAAYRQDVRARLVQRGTTLAYVEQTLTGPDGQPIRALSWQWVPTDSVVGQQTIRAHPTARYLTVPLVAEWLPTTAARRPRWQPVLAAGLVPHLLLNARSATITSGCDCETAPSARRRFALGLTAEAGFDYALTPALWLAVRPAATYLLTNAAAAGQPARHPWRAGLTVGLRWNPPPRAARR